MLNLTEVTLSISSSKKIGFDIKTSQTYFTEKSYFHSYKKPLIPNYRVYFILLISFCEFTLNIVVYINIFS
jgi:hypothetical protein